MNAYPKSVGETNFLSGTPLHLACINGHETISDLLIKCGAQLAAKDVSGIINNNS